MFARILLLLSLVSFNSSAQVVFLETFDEADDATTGFDNTAGTVAWTALCPGSVAATDYFKVVGGVLEAKDTNSPEATWTTGSINIISCAGLEITMDITETHNMEECADCAGTGATCIDWVKVEYNLDGSGWTEMAGTSCPATMTSAPGDMVVIGDIVAGTSPGTLSYVSECIGAGTTLEIRVSCMSWAADEEWQFDNIQVACNDCVLDAEINNFEGFFKDDGTALNWSLFGHEEGSKVFIERSSNGYTFSTLNEIQTTSTQSNYTYFDLFTQALNTVYYRLRYQDVNGNLKYSNIIQITPYFGTISFSNRSILIDLEKDNYTVNFYDLSGKLVYSENLSQKSTIHWEQSGFYIIEIPEIGLRQKLSIP